MALVSSAAVQKKKPLMLKDYLLDDLSSCSSSGFKSFPRRQCCTTTVRFLLELDIKASSSYRSPQLLPPPNPKSAHSYNNDVKNRNQSQQLRRSRSRAAASTTLSTLQRASGAVINAVKSLSVKSSSTPSSPALQSRKGGLVVLLLLPQSISRRLRRKSKEVFTIQQQLENKDIGRWRSFHEFLEDDKPSDQTTSTATSSSTTTSTDSSKSNSWGESEFNSSSESSNENEKGKMDLPEKEKVSGGVGVTDGDDAIQIPTTASCSPQNSNQVWLNKEEDKEQFSPVSVLDCPFEDEASDSTGSSPFRCRIARMEGTQHRLMQNIRRFEKLAQLEPLDLEKRIAMTEEQDNKNAESKTEELLVKQLIIKTTSRTSPCECDNVALRIKADKLVVDLFREESGENCVENVVKAAEEWVNGESREMLTSWEVENGRQVYVNDMSNKQCGKWMRLDEQEKEVGFEVEAEIWNSLFDEFLLDLIC